MRILVLGGEEATEARVYVNAERVPDRIGRQPGLLQRRQVQGLSEGCPRGKHGGGEWRLLERGGVWSGPVWFGPWGVFRPRGVRSRKSFFFQNRFASAHPLKKKKDFGPNDMDSSAAQCYVCLEEDPEPPLRCDAVATGTHTAPVSSRHRVIA